MTNTVRGKNLKARKKRAKQIHWEQQAINSLFRPGLRLLLKPITGLIRKERMNKPVRPWLMPTVHPELPTGPYIVSRPDQVGDLLIFVPRSVESHLIDHVTGGYGYSHVAVDCGEVEILTGRRVMIESTVNQLVSRVFLNKYGKRPYVRVHLARAGVPIRDFCSCVSSRLGEPYDDLEALTWGRVDNPAKQICSSLATDCLPDDIRLDIATSIHQKDRSQNAVSLQPGIAKPRIFISPNALARFFGAKPGYKIDRPGVVVQPSKLRWKKLFPIQIPPWRISLAMGTAGVCAGLIVVALRRMSSRSDELKNQ